MKQKKLLGMDKNCTHFFFGDFPVSQLTHTCGKCNLKEICSFCYETCHIDCNSVANVNSPKITKFVCGCAVNLNHHVKTEDCAYSSFKCNLRKFDHSINIKSTYNCISENLLLCSFCAIKCYSNRGYPTIEELDAENAGEYSCECKNKNHPTPLDFVFSTSIKEYNLKFQTKFKSNFHLLNYVLESDGADELFEYISKNLETGKINEEFIIHVKKLAKFYKQHVDEATFFPGEKLVDICSLEKLMKFLKVFTPKTIDEKLVLFDLMTLLYHIHILPDLSGVKQPTTGDFINSCIVERLSYRLFINSGNLMTKNIDLFKNNIYDVIIKLLSFSIYENIDYKIFKLLELIKVIDLFARLMIFSETELDKIVESLFILQKEMDDIGKIDIYVGKYNIQYELGKYLMKLGELLITLCIIKNDYTVDRALYAKGNNDKDLKFLHSVRNKDSLNCDSNEKLLQLIVKTQRLTKNLTHHLIPKEEKKILYYLRLSLNLFSSSDNIYQQQLASLENLKNSQIGFDKLKFFDLLKLSPTKADPLIGIKNKFQKCLSNNCLSTTSKNFYHEMADIFMLLDEELETKDQILNNNDKKEEFSEYVVNILKSTRSGLRLLRKISSPKDCDVLIENLTKHSFDVTFSNIIFDCLQYQASPNEEEDFSFLIRLILDYFELFCLNKNGLTYLLLGKNLLSIIKLISLFPIRSLNLIQTIFKGIKVYGMEFKYGYLFSELNENFFNIINTQMTEWKTDTQNENLDDYEEDFRSRLMGSAYNTKTPKTRILDLKKPETQYQSWNTNNFNAFDNATRKISDVESGSPGVLPKLSNKEAADSKSYEYVLLIMKIVNISGSFMNETDLDQIKQAIRKFVLSLGSKGILDIEVLQEILTTIPKNLYGTEGTKARKETPIRKVKYDSTLNNEEIELKLNTNYNLDENKFTEERSFMAVIPKNSNLIEMAVEFYFEFYKLICKSTYYNNYEEYLTTQSLLNKSMKLFMSPNLAEEIKHKKKIILRVIRSMAFSDFIDERNFQKDLHLTNEELENFFAKANGIKNENKSEESSKVPKYKQAKSNIRYIRYLEVELQNVSKDLHAYDNKKGKKYLTDLLLTIKTIIDYIYFRQNIARTYCHPLFSLVKTLVNQTESLVFLYDNGVDRAKQKRNLQTINSACFDRCDIEKMYVMVDDCIENILNENIRKENFIKILKEYDSFSLIDNPSDRHVHEKSFEVFYKNFSQKYGRNVTERVTEKNKIIENLLIKFNEPLKDFKISVFYKVLLESNYFSAFLIDDFINFITDLNYNTFNLDECIYYFSYFNKMLLNSTSQIKNKFFDKFSNNFLSEELKSKFFYNLKDMLIHTFSHNFCSNKNYLNPNLKLKVTMANKNILTFIHLLSINSNPREDILKFDHYFGNNSSENILGVILENLSKSIQLLRIKFEHDLNMPYDILIIQIEAIMEFLIGYLDTTDATGFNLVYRQLRDLLEKDLEIKSLFKQNFDNFSFDKKPPQCTQRINIIYFVKTKIIKILNRLAQSKHIKGMEPILSSPCLYLELIHSFYDIVHILINEDLVKKIPYYSYKNFYKYLMHLFGTYDDFKNSIQFTYCLQLAEYIKIMKKIFNRMRSFEKLMMDSHIVLKKENSYVQPEITENLPEICKKYITAYRIYSVLNELIIGVEIKKDNRKSHVFFIRPHITYYLSNETKENFERVVERENTSIKLNFLTKQSDYFIYEMLYYSRNNSTSFNANHSMFVFFELVNYLMILTHQALIIYYFYKNPHDSNYNDLILADDMTNIQAGNFILGLIQGSFLFLTVLFWLIYRFPLKYQSDLITIFPKKYNLNVDEIEDEEDKNNGMEKNEKIMEKIEEKFSISEKLVTVFNSIMYNNEVNVFIATLICVITYLTTGSPLCIVIPTLFIFNLSPTLYDIVMAVKRKWNKLILIILFTWVIIYLFSWISLIWLSTLFEFDDTKDLNLNHAPENFCTSSIQCIFFMIDWGFRSGGGIGDILAKMSYRSDPSTFFGKLFYNLIFYIIIIMVMGNIFLGIIVDALIAQRKKKKAIEMDRANVCIICQLTRDEALVKNINFDKHRKIDHNLWNYVYFLTYIKLSDEKSYGTGEKYVQKMLEGNKMSWIPVEEKEFKMHRNVIDEKVHSNVKRGDVEKKFKFTLKNNLNHKENKNAFENFDVDAENGLDGNNNERSQFVTPFY